MYLSFKKFESFSKKQNIYSLVKRNIFLELRHISVIIYSYGIVAYV